MRCNMILYLHPSSTRRAKPSRPYVSSRYVASLAAPYPREKDEKTEGQPCRSSKPPWYWPLRRYRMLQQLFSLERTLFRARSPRTPWRQHIIFIRKQLSNTTEPTRFQLIHSYHQHCLAHRQILLCAFSGASAVTDPSAKMLTIIVSRVRRILPQGDCARLHRHDILMRCQKDRLQ